MAQQSPEGFSWKKLFTSMLNGVEWTKSIVHGLRMSLIAAVILGVCLIVYRFFSPSTKQTQQTTIRVESGGKLELHQQQKAELKKRAWWFPSPYAELYAFKETDRTGAGARGGLKWEF